MPATAATAPTVAPLASSTSRRCLLVAPTAASMPSWRRRRWATTTKPAAAIRATSSRTTVARASAPAAAVARSLWVAVAQSTAPWQAGRASSRPPASAGSAAARSAAGPHQDRHRRRRVGVRRGDQGELVVQVARVLDQADDGPGTSVEGDGAADPGLEGRRDRVGDRHLPGGRRASGPPGAPASACRRRPGGPGRAAPGARPSPGPGRLGDRSRRRCRTRRLTAATCASSRRRSARSSSRRWVAVPNRASADGTRL